MAISLNDDLISLREAANQLPRRRDGKPTHPLTLARWAQSGFRGICLEVLRIGSTLFTTRAALQSFFEKTTKQDGALRGTGQEAVSK
jgi:hypothetical protein